MTTGRVEPASDVDVPASTPQLLINVISAHDTCVVHVTGELDLAARDQFESASTAGHHPTMLIDLGGVTFMDCSGYSSLVAVRRVIEGQGRSLTITGQAGQPALFLDMIAELEKCPLRRGLNHRPASPDHLGGRRRSDSTGVPVAIHAN